MLDFEKLNRIYTVEYSSNVENIPLYISKRDTYEEGIQEKCISFEQAIQIVKDKSLFFSAEGSAFKSSWDLAIELNNLLEVKNCNTARMVYYKAKKDNTEIPKEIFTYVSEKTLKDWYENLMANNQG